MGGMPDYHLSPGLTVLLVKDGEETEYLLEFVLRKHGYRVIHSNSNLHVRNLILSMEPPDAVLVALQLSEATGLELLLHLRAQAHWKTVPVAMLTTQTESLVLAEAARLGAYDHILTPISPTRLVTRLNRLLLDAPKKTPV